MPGKRKSLGGPQRSRRVVPSGPQRRQRPTARNLKSLPVGEYGDGVVRGLVLRVKRTGRFWMLRYSAKRGAGRGPRRRLSLGMVDGPPTLDFEALGLGDYTVPESLGLAEARELARALLGMAAAGRDPLEILNAADAERRKREADEQRRRETGTTTLGELLDRYIEFRADPPKGWKPPKAAKAKGAVTANTLAGWRSLASGVIAPLRDKDPAKLTADEVEGWHEHAGTTRGTTAANRGLELLSGMYGWAMATRTPDGGRLLGANPCTSVVSYDEEPRKRTLSSAEIRAVWHALDGETYGDAVRLLLLLGMRKSEVTGATWEEIDFAAKVWRVPQNRSKTGEPRNVPLSAPALALLKERQAVATTRWVFPAPSEAAPVRSLQALMRRVHERSGVTDWTLHDLRRVVRSGLSALGVAREVAEYILGHLPPRLVRTYDRHTPDAEAAAALESWARRVASYVSPEAEGAQIVPISKGRGA